MKPKRSVFVAVLGLGVTLFGQSMTPLTQPQTFRVEGTIKDPLGAVIPGVEVTFQNERMSKTVVTNKAGRYEALDLPFGVYTMRAQSPGFRLFRRPLFSVTRSASLTFDVTLRVGMYINIVEVEGPGTQSNSDSKYAAADDHADYYHEESFRISSTDGVPFELYFRHGGRVYGDSTYTYVAERTPYHVQVFVAYNLFTLQADQVIYDAGRRIVEATGHVVAVDELGVTQSDDSMTFKIDDGHALRLR